MHLILKVTSLLCSKTNVRTVSNSRLPGPHLVGAILGNVEILSGIGVRMFL